MPERLARLFLVDFGARPRVLRLEGAGCKHYAVVLLNNSSGSDLRCIDLIFYTVSYVLKHSRWQHDLRTARVHVHILKPITISLVVTTYW